MIVYMREGGFQVNVGRGPVSRSPSVVNCLANSCDTNSVVNFAANYSELLCDTPC
jgi:hypothetical protein